MSANNEQTPHALTKAELRARIVGNSLEHDQEDIRFWQTASEQERGQTLYDLLRRTEAILASLPTVHRETQRLILQPGHIERQPKE